MSSCPGDLPLQFPATAYEDSSSASLVIRNSSSDCSQLFEFGVPQGSFLKVGRWAPLAVGFGGQPP